MTEEKEGETSAMVRERVREVWGLQKERFKSGGNNFNGRMTPKEVKKYCVLDENSRKLMKEVFDRLRLTGRSYNRILKVGRTIADMEGSARFRGSNICGRR